MESKTFSCLVCGETCDKGMELYTTSVCQECSEEIVLEYLDLHGLSLKSEKKNGI